MQRVRPIKIFDVALYVDAYKYYNVNKKQHTLGPAYCQAMSLLYDNACCKYCHVKGKECQESCRGCIIYEHRLVR